MRAAPPADHPIADRGLWAGAAAALGALAVAAPVLWAGDHLRALRWGEEAVGWGMPLLAAVAVWRRLSQTRGRRLGWDGTRWQLRNGVDNVDLDAVALRIDLGHAVLLSARTPSGREIWLPVERRDARASWHGLRVALGQPKSSVEAALSASGGGSA